MRPFLIIIGLFIAVSMLGQYNVKRVKPVMKIRYDSTLIVGSYYDFIDGTVVDTLIVDSLRHGYK